MHIILQRDKNDGFAAIEAILLVVILAAVVGVGAYVMHQKHQANATLNSTSSIPSQSKSQSGTTASIDQVTQQDAQTEAGVDDSADSQTNQNASSANSAADSVGGAYNETSL